MYPLLPVSACLYLKAQYACPIPFHSIQPIHAQNSYIRKRIDPCVLRIVCGGVLIVVNAIALGAFYLMKPSLLVRSFSPLDLFQNINLLSLFAFLTLGAVDMMCCD